MTGDLSNPLLVKPLQPVVAAVAPTAQKSDEPDRRNNLVGAGYQSFEDAVLKKLAQVSILNCTSAIDCNYHDETS